MNQKETFAVVRSLDRSRNKIVGLDKLVGAHLEKRSDSLDQETVQVMEAMKLIIYDITSDIEMSYQQLARTI